jgi:hypothetical protein
MSSALWSVKIASRVLDHSFHPVPLNCPSCMPIGIPNIALNKLFTCAIMMDPKGTVLGSGAIAVGKPGVVLPGRAIGVLPGVCIVMIGMVPVAEEQSATDL